ncbi:unnamed protein product [Ectocarpus sp. 12 AP-2014]
MVIDRTVSDSIGEHRRAAADMIARARERGFCCRVRFAYPLSASGAQRGNAVERLQKQFSHRPPNKRPTQRRHVQSAFA